MAGSLDVLNMSDIAFLKNPPSFNGTQISVQSVANSTWTSMVLDSSQYDNYNGHSNTINNSRYTCVVPGWYTVSGVVAFAANSTNARASRISINGNPYAALCTFVNTVPGLPVSTPTPVRDVQLAVGDYIEVQGWQNSGGALNTALATDVGTGLWVRFSHF